RPQFQMARFREEVHTLQDLQPGMVLEGVITNVTNFGAFVDIGVHQDGLVHISALADTFVKDPRSIVKAGQVVKVKVLEIDVERRRIALSMRLQEPAINIDKKSERGAADKQRPSRHKQTGVKPRTGQTKPAPSRGILGDALSAALKRR